MRREILVFTKAIVIRCVYSARVGTDLFADREPGGYSAISAIGTGMESSTDERRCEYAG